MFSAWTRCVDGKSWRVIGLAAVLALATGACGEYPLRESTIEETLPNKAGSILIGVTDRATARRALGEPRIGSEYWRFDLFRVSDKDTFLHWYLFPMAVSSIDMTGYVLVAYDESGTVTAYSTGVTRGGSWLSGHPGPPANLLISAGHANFAADFAEKITSLFVSADRRDAYLSTHRLPDKCTVLLGFRQLFYMSGISVDKGKRLPLPGGWNGYPQENAEYTTVRWLAPLQLAPGIHRIDIPRKSFSTFEATTEFTCGAGDLRFAAIGTKPNEQRSSGLNLEMDALISVSGEMPEPFCNQPLLIWRNGNWLAPMEPAP
jgi:hypothetical protein